MKIGMALLTSVLLVISLDVGATISEDVTPQSMKLQGFLSDRSGGTPVPASGTYEMQFALYDAEMGGLLLDVEGPMSVTTIDGHYEVELHYGASAFDGTERWIEITVEGELLSPRVHVVSAPFAYVADSLDGYQGSDLDDSDEIAAGDAHLQGQVDSLDARVDNLEGGSTDTRNTLDGAYDEGGPGAGRMIDADSGSVQIDGGGGLTVATKIGIAVTDPDLHRAFQIGNDIQGIGMDVSDGSPNAGYFRFGDNTGWKLHFGRSRETMGGPLNSDVTGVLMTLVDNGGVGIGTITPTAALSVAGQIESLAGGFRFPDGTTQSSATPWVNPNDFASINDAVAAASGRTVLVYDSQELSGDLVVPADVSLFFIGGGTISASGHSLQVHGPFHAGLQQVFTGFAAGSVVLKNSATPGARPEWWGCVPSGGGDCTAAVRSAFMSHNVLLLSRGVYLVDGSDGDRNTLLTIDRSDITIAGIGPASELRAMTDAGGFKWLTGDGVRHSNILVRNLMMNSANRSLPVDQNDYHIWLNNISHATITNCTFTQIPRAPGIAVVVAEHSSDCHIENNNFVANGGEDVNFYGSDGSVYNNSATGNVHSLNISSCYEIEGRKGQEIIGYEVYDTVIANNICRTTNDYPSAGDTGILVIGARRAVVSGNIVERRGTQGLKVIGSQNVTVAGNVVNDMHGTSPYGIWLTRGPDPVTDPEDAFLGDSGYNSHISVIGNSVSNTETGVFVHVGEVDGPAEGIIVVGNVFANNAVDVYVNNVRGLRVASNSYSDPEAAVNVNLGLLTPPWACLDSECSATDTFGYGSAGSDGELRLHTGSAASGTALLLDQNGDAQPFVAYDGREEPSASKSISTLVGGNSVQGFLRIRVNGVDRWIPFYDAPSE